MESVLILSMVMFLLSGPIIVKGQGHVYLFGDNVTLPCVSATMSGNEVFEWIDQGETVTIYSVRAPNYTEKTYDGLNNDKYDNFDIDNNYPNDVNLLINLLEVNDAGMYSCNFIHQETPGSMNVVVEAMPISVSISCEIYFSPDCNSTSSPTSYRFICTCNATGAYPGNLQLEWSYGAYPSNMLLMWSVYATDRESISHESNAERAGTFDYTSSAIIVPTEDQGSVTCTLNGYSENWEGVRHADYDFNPPICELKSICNETNTGVQLICACTDAHPAEGLAYSFFNDGELLSRRDINYFETAIEMGQEYTFGCRGCNDVNYGSASYVTEAVKCPKNSGFLVWAIVVIIVVVVCVVVPVSLCVFAPKVCCN
ncbi:uncharacterized protein [Apostichopus japonicus]|uniref:uncharacterized protein n=1 Tax=Stichopus japonicus TaxID=307972 RepID=UPI003AB26C35